MVHWIDVAHWFLDLDHPDEGHARSATISPARASGRRRTRSSASSSIPDNIQAHFEGTFSNADLGAMITFMGTDGHALHRPRPIRAHARARQGASPSQMVLGSNPRKGADFYDKPDGELLHLTNWVECIRSRKQPTAPAEAGVERRGRGPPRQSRVPFGPDRDLGAGLKSAPERPLLHGKGVRSRCSASAARIAVLGPNSKLFARSHAWEDLGLSRSDLRFRILYSMILLGAAT